VLEQRRLSLPRAKACWEDVLHDMDAIESFMRGQQPAGGTMDASTRQTRRGFRRTEFTMDGGGPV